MCKALGAYGLLGKCTLSNDIVFLYVLLDSISMQEINCDKCRCVYAPWKSQECYFDCEVSVFLASVNIILFYKKLEDNVCDEKSIIAKLLKKKYDKYYARAISQYPRVSKGVVDKIDQFYEMETVQADYRELADAFAESLKEIANYIRCDEIDKEVIKEFFLWMGRWIYVYDAWIDFPKDQKKKSFNPIRNRFDVSELSDKENAEIFEYLYTCQSRMIEYLQVLILVKNQEIIQNVIEMNFTVKMGRYLQREKHDKRQTKPNKNTSD